ncbi:SCP-like extracellular protein [Phytophthora palmivora]|uniref:SCP-like extracellular protein n=1 Tax=Phytophthora palmivora TaxID=4796 RepID=A0A2P4Y2G9_9STRA|nr:SCP-like extracellular protein [Phytophthora palmivora]
MQVSAVISFLAAAVMTVRAESFTAEDQAIWIDRHNYFRTTGLPWSAGDMRRIGWSADLATSAATTAEKCSATSGAGVNVYQSSSANSSSIIDEAIQQWVVETSITTLKTLAQPGASGVDVGAASDCPSGTTAKLGLCIVEGDVANNQIAPIPAGKLTYEVYPAYVANMQTVLIEAARALANGKTTNSTESTPEAPTAPTATTAAPTSTTAPTSSSSETSSSNAKDDSNAATKTSPSSSDNEDNSAAKTGSTKKTTTSSSSDTSSSSSSDSPSPATKTGKTTASSSSTDSSSESSTKQTSQTTDESAPGTVKASSDTGSTFTNQAAQTTTGSSTEQTSGSTPAPASTPSTANTESNTASKATSSADAASTINNKSATGSGGGLSPAGWAGMIVLAIVGIAACGVVMSYKRNQQRQREIMRDGGIRII